jgi:alpha-tubulin suppressor-like RCC1 family protein
MREESCRDYWVAFSGRIRHQSDSFIGCVLILRAATRKEGIKKMNKSMLLANPSGGCGKPMRIFSLALALAVAIGVLAGTAQAGYAAQASDRIVGIAANKDHSLVLNAGGKVFSWGENIFGQLGDGTHVRKSIPSPISAASFGGNAVRDVKAGHYHSLARTADGNLYAWGNNSQGELGDGTNAAKAVPVRVSAPDGVTFAAIEASYDNSLALTSAGKVYAWGSNYNGALGIGEPCEYGFSRNRPVQVTALDSETITDISSKGLHCLALTDDGRVYAWGSNEGGRLGAGSGLGDRINLPVPVSTLDGTRITKISAGNFNSLALDENGKVYEWGWRTSGATATPSHISFFDGKGIVDIDAGLNFSVALGADGKVYTWGHNAHGQLGNGPGGTADTPSQVLGLGGKNIVSVAAGYNYVIALSADGEISAWGDNSEGQLGNGSDEDSDIPILVDLSNTITPGGTDPDTGDSVTSPGIGGGGTGGGGTGGGGAESGSGGDTGGGADAGAGGGLHPNPSARVIGFGVTQKTVYIKRGKKAKLPYIAYATAPGRQALTWKAGKKKVATVAKGKATGKLTVGGNADAKLVIKAGKKLGTSKITLTSTNGKKLAIKVKVVKSLKKVAKKSVKIKKLSKKAARHLKAGQVKKLKAKFTKKATAIATWKSSNVNVARIDAAGKLTALKKGTAKITLKIGGKKKAIKIRVK